MVNDNLEHVKKVFWERVQARLDEADERDGSHITDEQDILRALVILHYELEDLKTKVSK